MGIELSRIKLSEPDYFHREYQNDLTKKGSEDKGACNQLLRVAQVALPFVALYKPFGQSMAFVMGGSRTLSCLSKTYCTVAAGKSNAKIASDMFHMAIAITSFAGTIFAHPLGMLITTCHDLGSNVIHLHQAWVANDSAEALKAGLQILNNSVYLGMFLVGSTEVLVTSLALQIITGLYQTSAEFKKGNYLEVGAGVMMATIRMNQIAKPISLLQTKWKLESLSKKAATMRTIENSNTAKSDMIGGSSQGEVIEVLLKYGKNPLGIPPLHYAIKSHDINAVKILVEHGSDTNCSGQNYGTPMLCAVEAKDIEIMKYLFANGANLSWKCLEQAALSEFSEGVVFLLDNKVPLSGDLEGFSLLAKLLGSKQHPDPISTDIIKRLIAYGVYCSGGLTLVKEIPLKTKFNKHKTIIIGGIGLLPYATLRQDVELVKLLVEHGASLDTGIASDSDPLEQVSFMFAKTEPLISAAKALSIDKNMNPYINNTITFVELNPLVIAYKTQQDEIAQYLLSKGANKALCQDWFVKDLSLMNYKELDGNKLIFLLRNQLLHSLYIQSLFNAAIEFNKMSAVKALFNAGALISRENVNKAAGTGNRELITWLLNHGGSP